ncbi:SPATA21 [Branchiostoma lanceolatum]|uniref:SPATA21 protein n=1 Tax=Branchiostoma lanceolatum TaxID=7740 RepID=A0A8K0EI27_BRALA|nr:SPATA21 [Branchiostoma lanceolatum]
MSLSRLDNGGGPLSRRTKSDTGAHRPKCQYLQYRRNALHPEESDSYHSSGSDLDVTHGRPSKFQLRRLSSAPGLGIARLENGKNRLRSIRQLADITASATKYSKGPNPAFAVDDIAEEEENIEGQRSVPNVNMEDGPTIVLNEAEEVVGKADNDVMDVTQNEDCRKKVSFGFTPEDRGSYPSQTTTFPFDNSNNHNNSMDSADSRNLRIKSPIEDRRKSASTVLTMEQRQAFREVFNLFDRTGGGTFDAEELDEALRSVNICVDKDDLVEVIFGLDKDGNGEIDFDEFLSLMTNTDRFLESLEDETDGETSPDTDSQIFEDRRQRKERESLLFQALTQFMKKKAIVGIGEIVGYFRTKYSKAPHVVGHYAAGARLIGLTEKQLHMRLEDLHASSKEHDSTSPYAQPLNYKFWWPTLEKKKKKKRENCHSRIPLVQFSKDHNQHNGHVRKELAKSKSLSDRRRGKVGWQSPRVRHTELKLPMMELVKQQQDKLRRDQYLNFDDLPLLRKNVTNATKSYYNMIWYARTKESKRHWEILDTNSIQSEVLRAQFARTYDIYSSPEHPRLTTGISTHHMATQRRQRDSRAWGEDTGDARTERQAGCVMSASRKDSNFLGTRRERTPSLPKSKSSKASDQLSLSSSGVEGLSEDRRKSIAAPGSRRKSTGVSDFRRLSEGIVGGHGSSVGTSESRRPGGSTSGSLRQSSDSSRGRQASTDRRMSAVPKETGGILPTLAEDR